MTEVYAQWGEVRYWKARGCRGGRNKRKKRLKKNVKAVWTRNDACKINKATHGGAIINNKGIINRCDNIPVIVDITYPNAPNYTILFGRFACDFVYPRLFGPSQESQTIIKSCLTSNHNQHDSIKFILPDSGSQLIINRMSNSQMCKDSFFLEFKELCQQTVQAWGYRDLNSCRQCVYQNHDVMTVTGSNSAMEYSPKKFPRDDIPPPICGDWYPSSCGKPYHIFNQVCGYPSMIRDLRYMTLGWEDPDCDGFLIDFCRYYDRDNTPNTYNYRGYQDQLLAEINEYKKQTPQIDLFSDSVNCAAAKTIITREKNMCRTVNWQYCHNYSLAFAIWCAMVKYPPPTKVPEYIAKKIAMNMKLSNNGSVMHGVLPTDGSQVFLKRQSKDKLNWDLMFLEAWECLRVAYRYWYKAKSYI